MGASLDVTRPPSSAYALSILSDDARGRQMGENARRQVVDEFDEDKVVPLYETYYEEVLAQTSVPEWASLLPPRASPPDAIAKPLSARALELGAHGAARSTAQARRRRSIIRSCPASLA